MAAGRDRCLVSRLTVVVDTVVGVGVVAAVASTVVGTADAFLLSVFTVLVLATFLTGRSSCLVTTLAAPSILSASLLTRFVPTLTF